MASELVEAAERTRVFHRTVVVGAAIAVGHSGIVVQTVAQAGSAVLGSKVGTVDLAVVAVA